MTSAMNGGSLPSDWTGNGGRRPDAADRSELENSLDLVRRAQAGDHAAFEQLFARYYSVVRALARKRMGPRLRREADSEDLAQEAMVEAIRDFPRFDVPNRNSLVALFVAIVENRMRANARRTRAQMRDRDREVTLARLRDSIASGTIDLAPADPATLPPEVLAVAELRLKIAGVLHKLDEHHRKAIELRIYQDLRWDEVAAGLGSPSANAARMTTARALIKLKTELDRIDGLNESA